MRAKGVGAERGGAIAPSSLLSDVSHTHCSSASSRLISSWAGIFWEAIAAEEDD